MSRLTEAEENTWDTTTSVQTFFVAFVLGGAAGETAFVACDGVLMRFHASTLAVAVSARIC